MTNTDFKLCFHNKSSIFNQLFLYLICAWFCWPWFRQLIGKFGMVGIFVLWLLTTDIGRFFRFNKRHLILLIWFLYLITLAIFGCWSYGYLSSIAFFTDVPLFFLGVFLFDYYYSRKEFFLLARAALISLVFFSIGSFTSIKILLNSPMLARIMATGTKETIEYAKLGIGGYGEVYSIAILLPGIVYILKKWRKIQLNIWSIVFLSFFVTGLFLICASYTMGIIFAIGGVGLAFLFNGKRKRLYFVIFAVIVLLSFLLLNKELIIEGVLFIASIFKENITVYTKIMDFIQVFLYRSFGVETVNRFSLYNQSWQKFISSPILGTTGLDYSIGLIGGHSTWLDLLGSFGVIGALPIFVFFHWQFKRMRNYWQKNSYFLNVLIIETIVIVFGVVNPFIYSYVFGYTLFFLVPALPFVAQFYKKGNHFLSKSQYHS